MSDGDNSYRFRKVDEFILPQISCLTPDDGCIFFGEYAAGQGWNYSKTNSIIYNLKKREGNPGYQYKQKAINDIAELYVRRFKLDILKDYVLVPVPPSGAKGTPEYDSRMLDILNKLNSLSDGTLDVRELVVQKQTTGSSHLSSRLSIPQLISLYQIDEAVVNQRPINNGIIIFDDVLTTGAHFKAMQHVLHQRFPNSSIIGVFFARTIHVDE